MRVLLDECVDEGFRRYLSSHDCQTARFAGLKGLRDSDLLDAAERANFNALVTLDRGLASQQNWRGRSIAVVVLSPRSTLLEHLADLIPDIEKLLRDLEPGTVTYVRATPAH